MWATQHQAEYKIGEIRRYEGLAPAMLDLAAGRIDGYISDIPAVQYYVKDKPTYKVVERIPTGEQYSIMFAKDSPARRQGQCRDHQAEGGRLHRQARTRSGSAPRPTPTTTTVKVADKPKL